VRQRSGPIKESTIETVGVDGTIVSRHFDVIFADDLVDEKNAKTARQRENTQTWFYKVLLPCLEPPDPTFEDRGELGVVGTRYHFADLYGHLLEHEAKGTAYRFPALDASGHSTWEEKFSTEHLLDLRQRMGNIYFSAQMQNDVEVMKGEIFHYDDMKTCKESELPKNLVYYIGVDLAIRQTEEADFFSITVVGLDKVTGTYYVVYHYEGKLRFSEQTKKIISVTREWNPIRVGVEINAYQEAQLHQLQDFEPENPLPVFGLNTGTDKITRAWKLTPLFEQGRVVFLEKFHDLVENFVRFPNTEKKDWFDSFDHAVRVSRMRVRKARREVGLL
jgi:predicted phage terminase large subunit-like protein